jgi:hypothetical protein
MKSAIREFLSQLMRRTTGGELPDEGKLSAILLPHGAQEIGKQAVAGGFDSRIVLDKR